ncbi:paraquat-inducible protein B [Phocoenobacter uteri]|uniref:Paraquat-inducible protein B n=1 Tax=Phocoenobacter uteri TaxID=146806 RepID=A0A379C990_9PAST|nr:MlaD family protein [Phocoenobacter uteri]MDG6882646.1 hypothetical protein [Phocoenobacter uteri]SUB58811.1 paraquat-inducible protein B [Phocoenobacter uteri]
MSENTAEQIPEAKIRPPRKISAFWLLPLIAFMIGVLLFFQILKERGETITIHFNDGAGLTAGKTAIRYQGIQIGMVNKVIFTPDFKGVDVQAEINPEVTSVLREDTKFWLVQPSVSLAGVSGLDSIVSGNYITLLPGVGEAADEFTAVTEPPAAPIADGDLSIKLMAKDLGSISIGANVYFKKVPVGSVLNYRFTEDKQQVEIDIIIDKKYAELVKKESHFWNVTGINATVNLDGISVAMDSLQSLLQGAIAFDSPQNSEIAKQNQRYTLYASQLAVKQIELAKQKTSTKILKATKLSGISKGSLVLYREFEVGEVLSVTPNKKGFDVAIFVQPEYQHLLSSKSRFWVEAGAEVDVSLKGVNIKTAPLMKTLKGAVSFDNVSNASSENLTLFSDYKKATTHYSTLTLYAKDGAKLSEGMPLKYMGLTVGNVEKLQLENAKKRIKITASINDEYYSIIARSGSLFKTISPEINSAGLQHLDAVLQNYIDIEAGSGKYRTWFYLKGTDTLKTEYQNGFPIVLESSNAEGLDINTPVYYRGLQVGIVERLSLNELGNRVFLHLRLNYKYRHLVRQKTQFWKSSGYTMNVGLNGATITSGTMTQLLNGGISFSTPSDKIVSRKAKANQHFILKPTMPKGAENWNQGIYK